jgi:hypothetical protein
MTRNPLTEKVSSMLTSESMQGFLPPAFRNAAKPKKKKKSPLVEAQQLEPQQTFTPDFETQQSVIDDPQMPRDTGKVDKIPVPLPAYNPDSDVFSKLRGAMNNDGRKTYT